ncbi:MAG: hypothetical protein LUI13_14275 [Lachnospiraceae bacterium]|nr:hypothetical protein [Lachnospiraceae bacterium]
MKKQYIAVMMGLVISLAPVGVYAEESQTEMSTDAPEASQAPDDLPEDAQDLSSMIMGTVTEIGEDSITITITTDETQTITLTDETQYQKMSGGMGGGRGTDGASEDGEAPSDAGGEAPSDAGGEAPSDAGGEAPSDAGGEAPSDAGGEAPSDAGGEAPSDAGGEAPSDAGGEAPSDAGSEAPSDAGGEAPSDAGSEAPSDMDGEASSEQGDMGGRGMGGSMETEEITLSDIETGDSVMISLDDAGAAATVIVQSMDGFADGEGGMGGGMDGSGMGGGMDGSGMGGEGGMGGDMGGGQSSGVDSYDAANTIYEDTTIDSQELTSTGTDENAVLVSSDVSAVLTNDTITRESDDSTGGDNSSFYGVGAAVLATDGTLTVSDCTISTDSEGGAGVFAYGDGVVYVMDTVIDTQLNTSGGIHVAGGGTLYAWDVIATTNGTSSAAVRSDRGSGTMVVDGGTYTSNGSDSPAVYCTADIAISDATLTATSAEAVCIEGLNTLRLYDCDLTGMAPDDERNDNTWTVIVYQSMSGDSEVGNGTFQMVGGTLTSTNGGLFYTTNTECTITLEDVEITAADDCEFFLQCTGNTNSRGWGTSGSNGSDCLFTAISQTMNGDVIWDSISTLAFYMTDGSTLTGAVVNDETWAEEGGSGYCNVIISEDSTWVVTGDSTVTSLSSSGMISDADGNTVTVVGTDGTVYVEGTSAYTITVEAYSDSADGSGASSTDSFDDHAVERPEV